MSLIRFLLVITLSAICSAQVFADCAQATKDISYTSSTASAGVWDNLVNNKSSLRYESLRLLVEAESSITTITPPDNFCPPGCTLDRRPRIVSKVFPQKYRVGDYPEAVLCNRLEKETAVTPIRFAEKIFKSTEEFSEWFSEFSRGNSDEGRDLYEKCPGDCSIRYETVVKSDNEKITVNCTTTCGVARDKDVPLYTVAIFYRWGCLGEM